MNTREQGDIGEMSAMYWLATIGAIVSIPVGHSPDYDLIAELDGRLLRVQVKTSTCWFRRRWAVSICTRGGNQSWTGLVKRLDASRCDYLFVLTGDGRRWFIPASALGGGTTIHVGGPKYVEFEVDPGDPIPGSPEPESASTIDGSQPRGDARAVKGSGL
ncbi:MAG: group I intron-associated PD-(D/E)XK endonuclease [Thermoleophilaceae bacterium]